MAEGREKFLVHFPGIDFFNFSVVVSKEQFVAALRAHQAAVDTTESPHPG
jgi:hypothetical protein